MSEALRTFMGTEADRGVKMSTIGVFRDLAAFFLPFGIIGAVIAVACAIVVLLAVARSAAGVVGGATGVWIVGAVMSLASGFSGQWIPAIVAGSALIVALVAGLGLRVAVRAIEARPAPAIVAVVEESAAAVEQPAVAPVREPRIARPRVAERLGGELVTSKG